MEKVVSVTSYYKHLGDAIRNRRRNKDFSQEYMAHKLGISQNAYFKIESGKSRCTVDRLLMIAKLLDADILELLYFPTDPVVPQLSNLLARAVKGCANIEIVISLLITNLFFLLGCFYYLID